MLHYSYCSRSISLSLYSQGETKPSKVEEEESMYEIPQLQKTLSDSGYEKALELSPLSKSTSSEEQLSGQSGMF